MVQNQYRSILISGISPRSLILASEKNDPFGRSQSCLLHLQPHHEVFVGNSAEMDKWCMSSDTLQQLQSVHEVYETES
jgi:hypothetical protein